MITVPQVLAQTLGAFLAAETRGRFGSSHGHLADFLPYAARLTLECIGNSDALYHDIEHSMLVALVGHDILMGRQLMRPTTPRDYANFILACLTHDIGYVRGVVQGDGDGDGAYVADVNGRTVKLPIGSSDAALAPRIMSTAPNCSSSSASTPWTLSTQTGLRARSNTRAFPIHRRRTKLIKSMTRRVSCSAPPT